MSDGNMNSLVIDYHDIMCPLCQLEHHVDYQYPKNAEEKSRFDFSYVCPQYQGILFIKIVYRAVDVEQIEIDPYAQYFPYRESGEIKGGKMSNEDDAMNDAANASDTYADEFGGIAGWAVVIGSLIVIGVCCAGSTLALSVEAGWFVP